MSSDLRARVAPYLLTFVAFFVTAKIGQYIYFSAHTSPALIWPPVGIAFAAVFLGGYRMLIPVALASLLATATGGASLLILIPWVLATVAQAAVGGYSLERIGFRGDLGRLRDIIAILFASLVPTLIAPTSLALIQYAQGKALPEIGVAWGMLWAGNILSVLIVTPLITTWSTLPQMPPRKKISEVALAFALLIGINYFLFWTTFSTGLGFPILYALIAVFIWMALRMEPRAMTMALLLTTVIGVAGTIIAHPVQSDIGKQLLGDELFIEFIAFIFLFLVAVVEERRSANKKLEGHINSLEIALETISSQDKAKNEFIAILAHELRNPLSPILSTLELLKLRDLGAESDDMIHSMEGHVRTMRRLLDDLLDIARVSQQKFELRREPTLLHPLLTHAVGMVQDLITARGHSLTVSMPQEKIWLSVDPVRFEQVVANLLNNAAKYTPLGGTIALMCSISDKNLVLSVSDNGIGIDTNRLEQIFEPFRQMSDARVNGGLGLGLYLSKQLIEMHGGTIEAHSSGLSMGTTFTIELPILTSVPMAHREAPLAQRISERKVLHNILVVDDNEAAAQGLSKLLAHRGHAVSVAYTGENALTMLKSVNADVIVLDIGLPDIDGYEVARRVRAAPGKRMLIALTGYGQLDDKAKAREAGFDHHLTKPVGFSEIEDLLMAAS